MAWHQHLLLQEYKQSLPCNSQYEFKRQCGLPKYFTKVLRAVNRCSGLSARRVKHSLSKSLMEQAGMFLQSTLAHQTPSRSTLFRCKMSMERGRPHKMGL